MICFSIYPGDDGYNGKGYWFLTAPKLYILRVMLMKLKQVQPMTAFNNVIIIGFQIMEQVNSYDR